MRCDLSGGKEIGLFRQTSKLQNFADESGGENGLRFRFQTRGVRSQHPEPLAGWSSRSLRAEFEQSIQQTRHRLASQRLNSQQRGLRLRIGYLAWTSENSFVYSNSVKLDREMHNSLNYYTPPPLDFQFYLLFSAFISYYGPTR